MFFFPINVNKQVFCYFKYYLIFSGIVPTNLSFKIFALSWKLLSYS